MPAVEFHPALVLLAAGASSRMGRPKLLLPWENATVLSHLLTGWRALGVNTIVVVTAGPDSPVDVELNRLGFDHNQRITNPHPEREMFSSIQCAARWPGWNPEITHWIISLGDQPHVRSETLRSILRASRDQPDHIVQPAWQGRPKHPVILPKPLFQTLPHTHAPHFKAFLEPLAELRLHCPVDDEGLALDLDRPEDYEAALRLVRGREATRRPTEQEMD